MRPISADEIEPLYKISETERGPRMGDLCIYISGSQTDCLNQGCVRPHDRLNGGSGNADIFAARALVRLFQDSHPTSPCKGTSRWPRGAMARRYRRQQSRPYGAMRHLCRRTIRRPSRYTHCEMAGPLPCIGKPVTSGWPIGTGSGVRVQFRFTSWKAISFTPAWVRRW